MHRQSTAVENMWKAAGKVVRNFAQHVHSSQLIHIPAQPQTTFPHFLPTLHTGLIDSIFRPKTPCQAALSPESTDPITTTYLIYKGALI